MGDDVNVAANAEMDNLVFLPGASGSTDFWRPVVEQLAAAYNTTILAYPEFGGANAQADVNSFDDLQRYILACIAAGSNIAEYRAITADTLQALEAQEKQSASTRRSIVAQSMGGIFAVQAALKFPKLIKALVLVATSGGIDLSGFDVLDWRQDYQLTYAVPNWFVGQHEFLDDQLAKIECPILLIWGDQDLISPVSVGEYLAAKFSHASLHIIQGGGHDLAKVHSDQVSALIQCFLHSIK